MSLCIGYFSIERDGDSEFPSAELDKRVDWIGAALVTGGMVCIMFVLGQGDLAPQKWKTPCESPFPVSSLVSLNSVGRYHRPAHHRRRSPRRFHRLGRPSREKDHVPAFNAS